MFLHRHPNTQVFSPLLRDAQDWKPFCPLGGFSLLIPVLTVITAVITPLWVLRQSLCLRWPQREAELSLMESSITSIILLSSSALCSLTCKTPPQSLPSLCCGSQTDRAVQLLLETSADNSSYYCDSLKACLVTTITSSGPSQSTIKLVATNMIANGKLAGSSAAEMMVSV